MTDTVVSNFRVRNLARNGSEFHAQLNSPGQAGAKTPTLATRHAKATSTFPSLRRNLTSALLFAIGFGVAIFFLLFKTVIAGAVITAGTLVVESGPKLIQHPSGGVISEILVQNGDYVSAGDILIRLDENVSRAQLASARLSLAQQQARNDRLVAERDGMADIDFGSVDTTTGLSPEEYESIFQSERLQFVARRTQRESQRDQMRERIVQTRGAVEGLESQLAAAQQENSLLRLQLARITELKDQELVTLSSLSEIERTVAQSDGTLGAIQSEIAVKQGLIAEMQLQVLQVDLNLRAELTDQIWQVRAATTQALQDQTVAQNLFEMSSIKAPHAGTILDMTINTEGGVIAPGAPIMSIVPDDDQLVGEVRIAPSDIDQVYPNQDVTIQFAAFDRGTTPSISGTLIGVSAGILRDPATGQGYYTGRVKANEDELTSLEDLRLVPGMPIEVFIKTGDRTLITYLTKPLFDQINRAFR